MCKRRKKPCEGVSKERNLVKVCQRDEKWLCTCDLRTLWEESVASQCVVAERFWRHVVYGCVVLGLSSMYYARRHALVISLSLSTLPLPVGTSTLPARQLVDREGRGSADLIPYVVYPVNVKLAARGSGCVSVQRSKLENLDPADPCVDVWCVAMDFTGTRHPLCFPSVLF